MGNPSKSISLFIRMSFRIHSKGGTNGERCPAVCIVRLNDDDCFTPAARHTTDQSPSCRSVLRLSSSASLVTAQNEAISKLPPCGSNSAFPKRNSRNASRRAVLGRGMGSSEEEESVGRGDDPVQNDVLLETPPYNPFCHDSFWMPSSPLRHQTFIILVLGIPGGVFDSRIILVGE